MTVSPKKRREVFDRDGEHCVVSTSAWCAMWPCDGILTIQHRRGKGMGGSKKADEMWNLVPMCLGHNTLETANAEFHQVCVQHGWSVPRWSGIPSSKWIPVWNDGWWLLGDKGRFQMSPEEVEARMREVYGVWDVHRTPTHW